MSLTDGIASSDEALCRLCMVARDPVVLPHQTDVQAEYVNPCDFDVAYLYPDIG